MILVIDRWTLKCIFINSDLESTLPEAGILATALAGRIGGVFFVGADNPDGGLAKMQIGNGPIPVVVDGVQREGKYATINDILRGM